ncbi:DUF1489 family protein [Rhizobium sp. YJ-22]|uniref:DUF1489 family protein n=1 Tax=Rhizobium sp. YJ-22 TaxID=3037556 RepID=UPI0024126BB0|nr:DUF1489 family protein [Rhizobium sp. YJ-22]MDG3578706.1 DUF1489 family protein [Rhizobium sp. YJ-22]
MALHLLKLCVGADTIEDLRDWVSRRSMAAMAAGFEPHSIHTTRMIPKQAEALLDGGSLYWVIKGQVQARQKLLDLRSVTGADGITRCELLLGPEVIETALQPRRPFQGWRYLKPEDAPVDLSSMGDAADLPDHLRRELSDLGLL